MTLPIVDKTFIKYTLAETYHYGFNYDPKKPYYVIKFLKQLIPKKTKNFEYSLLKMLYEYLGPCDILSQPYYYTILHYIYKNKTVEELFDLIDDYDFRPEK